MALSTAQRVAHPPLPKRQPPSAVRTWGPLLALPLLLFLVFPLLALIVRVQPGALLANLANPQVRQAINLSLLTTFLSTWVTLCFGTPLAYWLARHPFRGRAAIDTLLDLPMVLPPLFERRLITLCPATLVTIWRDLLSTS